MERKLFPTVLHTTFCSLLFQICMLPNKTILLRQPRSVLQWLPWSGQTIFSILKWSYTKVLHLHLHFNRIWLNRCTQNASWQQKTIALLCSKQPTSCNYSRFCLQVPWRLLEQDSNQEFGFQAWQCFSSFCSVPSTVLVMCTSRLLPLPCTSQ